MKPSLIQFNLFASPKTLIFKVPLLVSLFIFSHLQSFPVHASCKHKIQNLLPPPSCFSHLNSTYMPTKKISKSVFHHTRFTLWFFLCFPLYDFVYLNHMNPSRYCISHFSYNMSNLIPSSNYSQKKITLNLSFMTSPSHFLFIGIQ